MFAEFLLFFYIFPLMHTCVGLTKFCIRGWLMNVIMFLLTISGISVILT